MFSPHLEYVLCFSLYCAKNNGNEQFLFLPVNAAMLTYLAIILRLPWQITKR